LEADTAPARQQKNLTMAGISPDRQNFERLEGFQIAAFHSFMFSFILSFFTSLVRNISQASLSTRLQGTLVESDFHLHHLHHHHPNIFITSKKQQSVCNFSSSDNN
jgi:hypothetical protein